MQQELLAVAARLEQMGQINAGAIDALKVYNKQMLELKGRVDGATEVAAEANRNAKAALEAVERMQVGILCSLSSLKKAWNTSTTHCPGQSVSPHSCAS